MPITENGWAAVRNDERIIAVGLKKSDVVKEAYIAALGVYSVTLYYNKIEPLLNARGVVIVKCKITVP